MAYQVLGPSLIHIPLSHPKIKLTGMSIAHAGIPIQINLLPQVGEMTLLSNRIKIRQAVHFGYIIISETDSAIQRYEGSLLIIFDRMYFGYPGKHQ